MAVDPTLFRQVMGRFATGVTVVTSALDGEPHGMTASAVCSVSLEPLLALVCIDKSSHTHPIVERSGVFALNVLARDQEHLSRLFADASPPQGHELLGVPYRQGLSGAPIIEGCLAYVECRVVAAYPGGDHTIFLGQVEDAGIEREAPPLLFFGGRYGLGEGGASGLSPV